MTIHTIDDTFVENIKATKEAMMLGCEPFTEEQERALLDYFSKRRYAERNIAILTFGIQTGFRVSEILALRRRDIEQNGKIVDRVYMRKYNMKGGQKENNRGVHGRAMLLAPKTKRVLRTLLGYLDKRGFTEPDSFLFQTQRDGNRALDGHGFWRILYDAKHDLDLTGKIGTHSMRKTFAARIYANLLDKGNADALRILQAGLGHENINNTIKYLSFNEGELIEAIHDVFGGEE